MFAGFIVVVEANGVRMYSSKLQKIISTQSWQQQVCAAHNFESFIDTDKTEY